VTASPREKQNEQGGSSHEDKQNKDPTATPEENQNNDQTSSHEEKQNKGAKMSSVCSVLCNPQGQADPEAAMADATKFVENPANDKPLASSRDVINFAGTKDTTSKGES
jgi:hypothetical protein